MAVQQMSNTRKFMGKLLFLLELHPSGPFVRKKGLVILMVFFYTLDVFERGLAVPWVFQLLMKKDCTFKVMSSLQHLIFGDLFPEKKCEVYER